MGILFVLFVAGVAGWIAGKLMDCNGNVILNVIIGIFGGIVGNVIFAFLGFYSRGLIGNIIVGVVGSCVLIWLYNLLALRFRRP